LFCKALADAEARKPAAEELERRLSGTSSFSKKEVVLIKRALNAVLETEGDDGVRKIIEATLAKAGGKERK